MVQKRLGDRLVREVGSDNDRTCHSRGENLYGKRSYPCHCAEKKKDCIK